MKLKLIGLGIIFLLISCKTYTITPQSFKSQFTKTDNNKMKEVETNNPLFYKNFKYLSNDIKYLNATDKKGNLVFVQNSPSLEMRVTLINGKKKYFYFDTVTLENDTLKGGKSRFMSGLKNIIPFDQIVKIELQEGGKNYYYNN
mgnify:CR=1 FL=1|jgi:hypothetical protein